MSRSLRRSIALVLALLVAGSLLHGCFVEVEQGVVEGDAPSDDRLRGVWVGGGDHDFSALAVNRPDGGPLIVDMIRYERNDGHAQILHNRFRVRTGRIGAVDYLEAEHLGPALFWSPETLVRRFVARYALEGEDRLVLAFPKVSEAIAAVEAGRLAGTVHGGTYERAVRLAGDAAGIRAWLTEASTENRLVYTRLRSAPPR